MPGTAEVQRDAQAVGRDTRAVERSRPFRLMVRAGFVARALTYGVIGAITMGLAVGAGSAPDALNQQGALSFVARAPLGRVAVGVAAAGLLAYALWKLGQAGFGRGPEGGGGPEVKDRISNAAGGIVYLAFFVVAVRILLGSSGSGSREPSKAAAGVLGWPGGSVLVAVAGAGLIAISAYQVYDAFRGRFAEDSKLGEMGPVASGMFMLLGHVGLVARGLVFALVGYFLVKTAIDFNPHETVGLDGALGRVHHQPFGAWLLGFVAAGLLVFASYSLLEARYRRL